MHNVQRVSSELDALIVLARRLHRTGRLTEVAATYQKILAIQPDFAEVHNDLGILLAQEKFDEAKRHYELAIALTARAKSGPQQPGEYFRPAAPVR